MRVVIIGLFALLLAGSWSGSAAGASSLATDIEQAGAPVMQEAEGAPGDDDDVVEVQLVVLGIVIGSVFVLGTGAYVLRRRLGLTAYTPPSDSGHH